MVRVGVVLGGAVLVTAVLWTVVFSVVGVVAVFVAPPVGLFALAVAALPPATAFFVWLGRQGTPPVAGGPGVAGAPAVPLPLRSAYAVRVSAPGRVTRELLERGLLTAMDLAAPMAGPGAGGPWMPVDVTVSSPPAVRPLGDDGQPIGMLAEAGTVLAGPGPYQAVRHMIAAYEPAVAEGLLAAGEGTALGVFGEPVVAMERMPDVHPVGEARTTVRIVSRDGLASHVVVWRRGPLVGQLAARGDETLATILLGHATQAADDRLRAVLASLA